MNKYLKIFLGILVFSSMNNFIHAWNDWYTYPYVCNNSSCLYTEEKKISRFDYNLMLTDVSIEELNLKSIIDNSLSVYSDLYKSNSIPIYNLSNFTSTWTITKNFTFLELINEWAFSVNWVNYRDWKDYLFSNFFDVIKKFHSKANLPVWIRKSNLSDIHDNILSYSNRNFTIKRVCENEDCTKSSAKLVNYNSYYNNKVLLWKIANTNDFPWLSISTNNISKDTVIAWDDFTFNFWFSDYLDRFKSYRLKDGDTLYEYEYEIWYKYIWSDAWLKTLVKENIFFQKKWSSYVLEAPKIKNPEETLKLSFPKYGYWKLNIDINEWMRPTEAWKMNFYFSIRNKTTWAKIENELINRTPLIIIPGNSFSKDDNDVHITSKDFTLEKNNKEGFSTTETLAIKVNLKDQFWNEHFDTIEWYEISLETWSSDSIKLTKWEEDSKWNLIFSDSIIWVKSGKETPYDIKFRIMIDKPGYHKLNWFRIRAKNKTSETTYWKQYSTASFLIPKELYDDNGQLFSFFIKWEDVPDILIKCTNKPITIKSKCESDDFSWCNNKKDEIITFKTEDDNSMDPKRISIIDYAHNKRVYQYTMNHIDQTPPKMTLKKWDRVLEWDKYDFKASDDFYFEIEEKTTTTCAPEVIIDYKIEINWKLVESWILKKENVNEVEEKDNYAYLRHKIDLTKYLSKAELDKKIKISLNDSYWNTSEREVIFNIYPTDEWLFEQDKWVWNIDNSKKSFYTFKVSSQWDKYANMEDNYLYTVENLSDKFWNIIYDKKINYVKHDTTSTTWLKKIYINESKKSWWDALDIYDVSDLTNEDWNFSFNLRSYTPWEYSQYFESELYKWDDSYIPTGQRLPFFLNINWSPNNQFKKPILIDEIKTSTLETSSGALCKADTNWTWIPDVKSLLKYKIDLKNEWSVKNISDASLNINVDSIKSVTDWHKWLDNKLKEISNTFTDDTDNSCVWFKWQISATENILQSPVINTDNLEISYRLKWNGNNQKLITYILENSEILWCDVPTLWVKVEWTLQWDWKWELTWQETNFSDISMSEMRWTIRKNAFELIRNMNGKWEWQILNGIRYVEWNVTIWWEIKWYETLIVKNWNVFIDSDLNLKLDKFWIIVLKDNYNVNTDYKISWNVYIKNNVEKINAVVYADWTFKSAKDFKWTSYEDAELSKKLVLNWTLFTRNTIWWATELIVEWLWWDYLLPGWKWIKDYELAANYDLNFVRKAQFCEWDPEAYAFLVRYNAKIQTNPPKWFSSK